MSTPLVPKIPYPFAKAQGVLPWCESEATLTVLIRPGASVEALQEVRRVYRKPVTIEETDAQHFNEALARAYNVGTEAGALNEELARDTDLSQLLQEMPTTEDLLDDSAEAPVIRMINALLLQALREQVSDLHFEPYETRSVVRFRLDGVLRDVIEPPRALHAALVSRLKIMASLDIAEKRLPQDGRITLRLGGKSVDVRVSTLPTGHGERVVLRLLDKEAARLDLSALGMGDSLLTGVDRIIREPHGIFLVTGPTGSGKTTTLYAALSRLERGRINLMTVEDPIEYALDGVAQTQVNPRIELTFARALRSILRQDPDVVMIGEIRDLETAQIAVQASLTGHLVLATLHTNDAPSAITRLADMGIEPYLLASSLLGVLAQRLVRVLCPHCRKATDPNDSEKHLLQQMELALPERLYAPVGCEQCSHNGYRGRTGIYELLQVDDAMRKLIHEGASEDALRGHAVQRGMTSLRQDGMRWLRGNTKTGATSLAELVRVTRS
ncbi:MAG: type II secretion system ATPase GspE [Burkholderiales bacterium]|jgi:general secretion pathway protein E|nr:type II secretion system ATPase GspE [Burkholderiales bacterium]